MDLTIYIDSFFHYYQYGIAQFWPRAPLPESVRDVLRWRLAKVIGHTPNFQSTTSPNTYESAILQKSCNSRKLVAEIQERTTTTDDGQIHLCYAQEVFSKGSFSEKVPVADSVARAISQDRLLWKKDYVEYAKTRRGEDFWWHVM